MSFFVVIESRVYFFLNQLINCWMFYHVFLELRGSSIWVTALWALERFFSSVNTKVLVQSSCMTEWPSARFTVIWLLSTVGDKMLGKIFFCDWRKFALIALIWLFREVRFDVISKMTCWCSCIIALCALVWLSPLWISLYLFRSPAWPKESPHSSHFSPVWVITDDHMPP